MLAKFIQQFNCREVKATVQWGAGRLTRSCIAPKSSGGTSNLGRRVLQGQAATNTRTASRKRPTGITASLSRATRTIWGGDQDDLNASVPDPELDDSGRGQLFQLLLSMFGSGAALIFEPYLL